MDGLFVVWLLILTINACFSKNAFSSREGKENSSTKVSQITTQTSAGLTPIAIMGPG